MFFGSLFSKRILIDHFFALLLWFVLSYLSMASPYNTMMAISWVNGFWNLLTGVHSFSATWIAWQHLWIGWTFLGIFYFLLNYYIFYGFMPTADFYFQGLHKPVLVPVPFFHPFSKQEWWFSAKVDRLFRRSQPTYAAWHRFYFVSFMYGTVASILCFIFSVYDVAPGDFPADLFTAWGYFFSHPHAPFAYMLEGGHSVTLSALVLTFVGYIFVPGYISRALSGFSGSMPCGSCCFRKTEPLGSIIWTG